MMDSIKWLRKVGLVEGCSLLLLIFVAMPLKYFLHKPEAVRIVGWIHGFLFVLFMLLALIAYRQKNWPFKKLVFAGIAAFLPFGTFVFDKHLRAEEHSNNL